MTVSRSTPRPEGRPRAAWAGLAACLWLGLALLLTLAGGRAAAASPEEGRPSVEGEEGRAALPAGRAETLRTLATPAPGVARHAR